MSEQDELIQEFLVESYENLDRLDGEFLALEENPESTETLSSVFRTIHTIKGLCGFLGFEHLESVTHGGETLLSELREGRLALNEEITTALLRMVDAVREMLTHIERSGEESDEEYADLCGALLELAAIEGKEGPQEQAVDQSGAETDKETVPETTPAVPDQGRVPIGDILLAAGLITEQQIQHALLLQQTGDKRPLGELLVEVAGLEPKQISSALTAQEEHHDSPDTARPESSISSSNIRVQVDQLDNLMNLAGELVLARNQILQGAALSQDPASITTAQRLNLITSELQEQIMKVRMQPIGMLWAKLPRVVRDLAKQLGKSVNLEMEGKSTELDKTLLEAIKDPLTHLVRNAVDHGVEDPATREAAGKPTEGILLLRAYHESGQVFIEIVDDGAGIDAQKVRNKAVSQRLLSREEADGLSDRQACALIFSAGLSTATHVTNVSGRGVGMDVVKNNIEKIGGTVEVNSTLGKGTTILIKIPLTLAIIPALILTTAEDRYAIPQVSLMELVRLEDGRDIESLHGSPVYRLRGELLPLVFLDEQLGVHTGPWDERSDTPQSIVFVRAGEHLFGLVVDEIIDTEEIVVKPLDAQTKAIPIYAGTTILGDGRVALILDVLGIATQSGVLTDEVQSPVCIDDEELGTASRKNKSYLVVATPCDRRLAIELDQVDRLEEFPRASVEHTGTVEVVQYRDEIMPLVRIFSALGIAEDDAAETLQVVVTTRAGQSIGLVVHGHTDIVETSAHDSSGSPGPGIDRSMIVDERVTEILDVESLLQAALGGEGLENATGSSRTANGEEARATRQLCTFYLGEYFFGVDVTEVQEVLRTQPMTRVPGTNEIVRGLINLRGQTITALDMRERMSLPSRRDDPDYDPMNMVLNTGDGIVSILVDSIGDVVTVEESLRASVPPTVSPAVRSILTEVYVLPDSLLLPLDIDRLVNLPAHAVVA